MMRANSETRVSWSDVVMLANIDIRSSADIVAAAAENDAGRRNRTGPNTTTRVASDRDDSACTRRGNTQHPYQGRACAWLDGGGGSSNQRLNHPQKQCTTLNDRNHQRF